MLAEAIAWLLAARLPPIGESLLDGTQPPAAPTKSKYPFCARVAAVLLQGPPPVRMNAMPVQLTPLLLFLLVALGAAVEGTAAVVVMETTIVTSSSLKAWCVIGAALGATVAVAAFPPESPNTISGVRRGLFKFVCSAALGFMCGPAVSRNSGFRVDEDTVMLTAGLISLLGVAVLHAVVPLIPTFVRSLAGTALAAMKAALNVKEKP